MGAEEGEGFWATFIVPELADPNHREGGKGNKVDNP